MNELDDFVRFKVTTNEVPIREDNENGKDIVLDWFMMDGFDTNNSLWTDANGLQMVPRKIDPTKNIQNNYFPITTAIAIKDHNKTNEMKK
jgi:hypothetical protein